jgi:hypothetical protein
MLSQFETDTNNKTLNLYLIVSQVYNGMIYNSFKINHKEISLNTLLVYLVR